MPVSMVAEHTVRYRFASEFVRGKRVIDIACGSGLGTGLLRRAGAASCLGIDIDSQTIARAAIDFPDCRFLVADAIRTNLPDNAADIVVSFETIEHLGAQREFLQECRRILQPGGLLICSTPNRRIWKWHAPNPFHVREFDAQEFMTLLSELFVECNAYSQAVRFYPAYVAKRLLSKTLDAIALKSIIRKIFKRNTAVTVSGEAFLSQSEEENGTELSPMRADRLVQPEYVIATARKSAD